MAKDFTSIEYGISQEELRYSYERGKARVAAHPDIAKKHQRLLDNCTIYKSKEEALEAVKKLIKEKHDCYQIWAKIETDEEAYIIRDHWIVTDDIDVAVAAEYIGMAQVYDEPRIARIIHAERPR